MDKGFLLRRLLRDTTAIVMAKWPGDSPVKTRLIGPRFGRKTAAEVAMALTRCIVGRLDACGRVVLAVAPDGAGKRFAAELDLSEEITVLDQGPGNLGDRLANVWLQVGAAQPVAFFGVDSPDLPYETLAGIPTALEMADAAVGPTDDGGYWTLAATRFQPVLVREIDWGTSVVYDQTLQRAHSAGLRIRTLPPWYDVDRPADLDALMVRLAESTAGGHLRAPVDEPMDQPLVRLKAELDGILARSGVANDARVPPDHPMQ